MVKTSDEGPGANCANGGTKVEAGIDTNANGTLDASEVTSTTYICDGSDGGAATLVSTTAEPAGTNCPYGGTRIQSGLDANKNGTLDAGEVNASATTYVCNASQTGTVYPSTGIVIAYKAVSTSATAPITVRFTLKDDRGYPVDINGVYSLNVKVQPRFALAWLTKDATTNIISPLNVYTKSGSTPQPTMYNPLGTGVVGQGTIVENGVGAGDYTYTFPTTTTTGGAVAVAYDQTKMGETHVVWMQVSRQTDLVFTDNANTYYSSNVPKYFVPNGTGTPIERNIAAQDKCDNCHAKFKAETTASAEFHSGGRVNVSMCNVCHNPGRTSNVNANSIAFVHRIHQGEEIATANLFHGIAATYPRDTRDCAVCHGGAAQDQSLTNPSKLACNGCHDYVKYDAVATVPYCNVNGNLARGIDGKPLPCQHLADSQPDSACAGCHGPNTTFATTRFHKPVAPPDPNNAWKTGGNNNNTHASFVAAGGYVPPGAEAITYDIQKVDTVADANDATIMHPRMVFKFKNNGVDVVFNAPSPTGEMIDHFTGSPSAYFAFAVPQDSITKPADFNASVSGYLKKIWNGTATGTGAGTLTGPDTNNSGYYTLVLTGVRIPAEATMLTGGLGYTYSLSSAPPLIQTNLAEYPVTIDPGTNKPQGGLSVPAPNVWKVATGYTARRPIVDNAKCKNCHGTLGVEPSFHAGQRNDGPTCSFCHTPNRSSAGWAAGSKYFIHAIHAGRKRTVPYTWHAASAGPGYDEIEFPGTLNACTTCHATGAYDFTTAASFSALANQNLVTVASGALSSDPQVNSTYYTISPYLPLVTSDYGAAFSFNAAPTAANGGYSPAAGTNLVNSPITNVCSSCHDTSIAITHMQQNGGQFYALRSDATLPTAPKEQCIICHGPGRIAAIGEVHQH